MANAALIYPFRAPPQLKPVVRQIFPFLSLPLEIRTIIYEFTIFPDDTSEIFIVNPILHLSLLRVCTSVLREASIVLYTKRIAVISFLPDQYYLHGRTQPLDQLFRITEVTASDQGSTEALGIKTEIGTRPTGHICPDVLVRFQRIRLCFFFNARYRKDIRRKEFNSQEEFKRIAEVLRDCSPSTENFFPGKYTLEIIVAIDPQSPTEQVEISQEERVREKFLGRGISDIVKDVRKNRSLKIGGNLTRKGLVKFYEAICGNNP